MVNIKSHIFVNSQEGFKGPKNIFFFTPLLIMSDVILHEHIGPDEQKSDMQLCTLPICVYSAFDLLRQQLITQPTPELYLTSEVGFLYDC